MPRAKNYNLFQDHKWEIMVIFAFLFFLIIILFQTPIQNWLKDKTDFSLPSTKIPKKFPPIKKIGEKLCREIFERIFNKPFPTVRPQFLRRSNGYCLELDGYNKELNLAFEYNGRQHYEYVPRFHTQGKHQFIEQVQRDKDKRELCKQQGIKLVEIPYTIPFKQLEAYIKEQLISLGILKI